MAEVRVLLDDALDGRLPRVCVKDGVPTADRFIVRHESRESLGLAWLLLLLPPFGWIALLVLDFIRRARRELLVVEVPMSPDASQRLQGALLLRRMAGWVYAVGFVLGFACLVVSAGAFGQLVLVMTAVIGFVGGLAVILYAETRIRSCSVALETDSSRRWLTITGVHPAFVESCLAERQSTGA